MSEQRAAEVETVLEAASAWARRHADIRALALAGSWAHGSAGHDSDLDLVVLTASPARYVREDERLAELAPVPRRRRCSGA